jgi:ATP-dependent DNA helicase RecG
MTNIEQLHKWLTRQEGLNLEFKEAKSQFGHDKDLPDYCAALANEGGGKLILGVTNKGDVVGTKAFQGTHNQLSQYLLSSIGIRVDVEELFAKEKRILIFHIPPRPYIGRPVKSSGKYTYPMRAGESLTEMDEQTLKKILNQGELDFSGRIVTSLIIDDLDEEAINNFKKRWAQKANRTAYIDFPKEKILSSVGVLSDKGLNYAALILFGRENKINELLPCSEIIFEWRSDASKTSHDFRINWRKPFFKIYDEIWDSINARNLRIPFQEGLFQREIYAFNEKAIREALLNAVTHRDYTISGRSIFIKASPQEFFIESPGGFPLGITAENILDKTSWRNRTVAEAFEKAGLVERAGQGMNDIFESTIKEGKGVPDFSGSDVYSVVLRIPAKVKDKEFIIYLEKIAKDKQELLSFDEIYELEKIREQQKVTNINFKDKFLKLGLIEKVGRTRDTRYILSHKYYKWEGKAGIYTRLAGLTRQQKKELILNHFKKNDKLHLKELRDVFPEMKDMDIANLLQELKKAGKIKYVGPHRGGYWIKITPTN